ncbi:retrograde transport, endosome to Golgi [Dermatophagoides farinae]|uniref:Retrograde transport, endosome to Golgi n=1 Tax=Dermatophagoides farinae TaxID=6954 RepID=A0A922IEG6_DERFA|nr:retrograde transport, endosome to Golgi [Dermatophagoides farinae]
MSENQDEAFKSINEFEQNKSKWNLIYDLKLLGLLKNTGDGFLNKIRQSLQEIENLSHKTNTSANKINNLITSILILTNVKFIENRVYDEDIKDITSKTSNNSNRITSSSAIIQPPSKDSDEDEKKLINRLENSIDDALKRLTSKYKISHEDFIGNNGYNLLHKLYSQKNSYVHRNLPYLIGSDEYLKDTFVGLKSDDSQHDTVINLTNDGTDSMFDNKEDIVDHANVSKRFEGQNFSPSIFPNNADDVDPVIVFPSTSKPFEPPPIDKNVIDIFNHTKNDSIFVAESSDDDDIFVRPTITNNRPLLFDDHDVDDDGGEIFPTASISTSHHDDKGSLFGNDNLEKNQSEVNNEEKSKIKNIDEKFLQSDSDNDSVDIFTTKTSRKSALKTTLKEFIFSSDDDDDDDLFNKLISKAPNKMEKQPDSNSLIINETIDDDPTLSPDDSVSTTKIQSKPTLSNVIKELNSVIQNKVSSSTNQATTIIPSSSSSSAVPDMIETKKETSEIIIDTQDELNSMLKHKLNLSSNRQRKPPSRNVLRASLSNPQSLFNDQHDNDDNPSSSVTLNSEKSANEVKTNEKIEPTTIPLENSTHKPQQPSPVKEPSKSLFDSSDSDDDLFKKPNLIQPNHQQKQTTITKKTNILFADSDDELDFQQPVVVSKTTTIKKKSIFDDDSDTDDDLFKF